MNPHNQQLFVLIVHYGDEAITRQALASLKRSTTQPSLIIVIDHGRTPLVVSPDPTIQVVRPSSGGGYAAGVNFGLGFLLHRQSQANDVVVVMNNDVEVYPDTLAHLLTAWRSIGTPSLIGVQVEERGVVVHGGGSVNKLTGRATLRETSGGALQYIHGAFIAAPYAVWLKLQGLPSHYYMYWEDVLLGRRARVLRIPLQYLPTVIVKHHTGDKTSAQQHYYLIRNGALFMQQELPIPIRWWWVIYNRLRYFYHLLCSGPRHRRTARALRDALMGKTGKTKEATP